MWVIALLIGWQTYVPNGHAFEIPTEHQREVVLRFDSEAACRAQGRLYATHPETRHFERFLRKGHDYRDDGRGGVPVKRTDERVLRLGDCTNTTPPTS